MKTKKHVLQKKEENIFEFTLIRHLKEIATTKNSIEFMQFWIEKIIVPYGTNQSFLNSIFTSLGFKRCPSTFEKIQLRLTEIELQ